MAAVGLRQDAAAQFDGRDPPSLMADVGHAHERALRMGGERGRGSAASAGAGRGVLVDQPGRLEPPLVFWGADFLGDVKGLGSGAAATLSAAFVLGMAAGRAASAPIVRAAGRPDRLLAAAALAGVAGFAILWASPAPLAVAGLLVAGLGVAIGVAPLVLGTLADLTALRAAVFVAPGLLPALLVRCGGRLRPAAGR
ncbi:hypothetical protein [Actinomadura sp. GTD37]|uniref:hypothetical protein n=1 Tax=Actinomadura sp. GTD37 TaxID=1778030 RepID=UPI0035C1FD04